MPLWAVTCALVGAVVVEAADCERLRLVDVAAAAGLDFAHERGARGQKHLPETMGAGVAWLDYDGDGWLDLYLVQSGAFPPLAGDEASNRLYRNLGGGRFEEAPAAAGAADRGYGQGATAVDVEGDGDTDLYVTNFGPDRLFVNDGAGRFVDATAAAGLGADGWSSSAALADAEGDGDLDLYVSRYVEYDTDRDLFCGDRESGERRYCDPSLFVGAGDLFYLNEGGGRFVEATARSGLAAAGGRGLGVVFTDLDGDSAPEIYVANDLTPNFLFRNATDGSFVDVSLISGTAVNREGRPEAGMGVAVGDVDGDGAPEIAVTNFDVETNTLYANRGGLAFEDVAATSGFGLPSFNRLAFGIALADFDRDGALDAYVANGHIFERPARQNVAFRQPDQLLRGDGRGGFSVCEELELVATVARGAAAADYDNDGDPDLAVSENGGPAALLRNEVEGGSWLGVALRGTGANREAIGAAITLRGGGLAQRRDVLAGDSYQSSSDKRALFGVAPPPEALEVRWRAGGVRRLLRPPAGRYLVVYE